MSQSNPYTQKKYDIIKYNAQSSPYNQAMQYCYINGIRTFSSSNNTSTIESTINVVKNTDSTNQYMNMHLLTINAENNMTDN